MTSQPTVCVTCVWAGVDNVWEQEKLEARKMLENAAESHTSGARFVWQFCKNEPYNYLLSNSMAFASAGLITFSLKDESSELVFL